VHGQVEIAFSPDCKRLALCGQYTVGNNK